MLTEMFGKTFVAKEYKQKRERDLFETEKALLPETQTYAIREKELKEINEEIAKLQLRLRVLKIRKRELMNEEEGSSSSTKTSRLTIKCPVNECRGFVDHSTMKCEVCKGKICKECHEVLPSSSLGRQTHECDPNTVETVKLLKSDTKNCPKCSVSIHKIEGCDQMYCTQCHTAFSWRTGEIVIGERIHNPHYYEYLRQTTTTGNIQREIGDLPCGGLPDIRTVHCIMFPRTNNKILNMHRLLTHIEMVELINYRTDRVTNNRDLRIKYLNNEISESEFKVSLQRREKGLEKKREILQVLNTCLVAGSDIFQTFVTDHDSEKATQALENLFNFTNGAMNKVSTLYACMTPGIRFSENGTPYVMTAKNH